MADLRLEDLGKTFAPSIRAVDEVSLALQSGEYLALLGPSGCGKSTLLRIIAGLERQTEGDIHIDGVNINALPPERREVALLFQRPAFILHQTVRQNLRPAWTAPSLMRQIFGASRQNDDELMRIANLLELADDLERSVGQLSGGQQQRVALGRCLLRKARVTLLDEPLGHLDAPLRVDLRRQIRALAREFGLTMIHVTHDPAEALAIGDRVAVMRQGRILQIDEARQLRRFPSHRFVAQLVHHETGGLNWLAGEIVKEGFDTYFQGALGRWPMSMQIVDHLRESLYKGEKFASPVGKVAIMMGIPAAAVQCTTSRTGVEADVRVPVKVDEMECSTAGDLVIGVFPHPRPLSHEERGDGRWIGRADDAERFERGQEATMTFSLSRAYWFDAATGRTLFAPG